MARKRAKGGPKAAEKGRNFSWEPNPNHLKALNYAKSRDFMCSNYDIMENIGLARDTFAQWCYKSPEFVRWWWKQAEKHMEGLLPEVYYHMYARATGKESYKDGSWQDAREMMNRFDMGYVPKQKHLIAARMALGSAKAKDEKIIDDLLEAVADVGEEASEPDVSEA